MTNDAFGGGPDYQICDALWEQMVPVLPPTPSKKKEGRPRMGDRQAMAAIFVLRTGCQWEALPRSLGTASTGPDQFRDGGRRRCPSGSGRRGC
jgi:putative transposase